MALGLSYQFMQSQHAGPGTLGKEETPAGGCEGLRLPPSSAHFVARANYPEPPGRAIKDV